VAVTVAIPSLRACRRRRDNKTERSCAEKDFAERGHEGCLWRENSARLQYALSPRPFHGRALAQDILRE
jgi:hypothetical protein